MLEERNHKLEKENEILNDKFMASSCIISDLNTKIKDLETDKMSLVASIKLIQIHDDYYADSCTSNRTTQIGDNPGSSKLDDSVLNLCTTNNENNNRQCSLKCKSKSKEHQTEESSMNQTSNSELMPSNADVLAVNNRFSILSDIDSQEDLLVINQGRPSGSEDDQIQNSSVQTDKNEDKQMQDNSAQRSGAAASGRLVDNTSEQVSPDTYRK